MWFQCFTKTLSKINLWRVIIYHCTDYYYNEAGYIILLNSSKGNIPTEVIENVFVFMWGVFLFSKMIIVISARIVKNKPTFVDWKIAINAKANWFLSFPYTLIKSFIFDLVCLYDMSTFNWICNLTNKFAWKNEGNGI